MVCLFTIYSLPAFVVLISREIISQRRWRCLATEDAGVDKLPDYLLPMQVSGAFHGMKPRPGSRIVVRNIGWIKPLIVLHESAKQMTIVAYLNTIHIVQRELFPLVILTGDIFFRSVTGNYRTTETLVSVTEYCVWKHPGTFKCKGVCVSVFVSYRVLCVET